MKEDARSHKKRGCPVFETLLEHVDGRGQNAEKKEKRACMPSGTNDMDQSGLRGHPSAAKDAKKAAPAHERILRETGRWEDSPIRRQVLNKKGKTKCTGSRAEKKKHRLQAIEGTIR